MRRIFALAGTMGALLGIWFFVASKSEPTRDVVEPLAAMKVVDEQRAKHTDPQPERTSRSVERDARPSLEGLRHEIILDRGPQLPGEDPVRYQYRVKLATDFDEFATASGISEDKKQRLLRALYDYQETEHTMRNDMREASVEAKLGGDEFDRNSGIELLTQAYQALDTKIDWILDDREENLWMRYCASCDSYLYVTRVLRLQDSVE